MSYDALAAVGLSLELPRLSAGMTEAFLAGMPKTPMTRFISANAELFTQTTAPYALGRRGRPAFGLNSTIVDGRKIPVHEEVVQSTPFCDLLHFSKEGVTAGNKILIVAPMSGHFATLLRGTVAPLLATHDVYITDWKNARDIPLKAGKFGLDDYVHTVMGHMRQLGPDMTVMAVCQATVPGLAAACLLPKDEQPKRLVLMAGPLDTRAAPTTVTRLAEEHDLAWFGQLTDTVPLGYPGAGRKVYPGLTQLTAFVSMNAERHLEAYKKQFVDRCLGRDAAADKIRDFYREYNAVMDLDAAFYLETIKRVFQTQDMANGRFMVRGVLADPGNLRADVRVLVAEGTRDDISGLGQTRAALQWMTNLPESQKTTLEVSGAGHYGVFTGSGYERKVLAALREMETYPAATVKPSAVLRAITQRPDTSAQVLAAE